MLIDADVCLHVERCIASAGMMRMPLVDPLQPCGPQNPPTGRLGASMRGALTGGG